MAHFGRVTSFADLKKQYRTLAVEHHPDKGGDTETMQEINAEFDKLYKVWEHRKDEATSRTGYESDFEGATSAQYQEYVFNEYRWRGSRYNGQTHQRLSKRYVLGSKRPTKIVSSQLQGATITHYQSI